MAAKRSFGPTGPSPTCVRVIPGTDPTTAMRVPPAPETPEFVCICLVLRQDEAKSFNIPGHEFLMPSSCARVITGPHFSISKGAHSAPIMVAEREGSEKPLPRLPPQWPLNDRPAFLLPRASCLRCNFHRGLGLLSGRPTRQRAANGKWILIEVSCATAAQALGYLSTLGLSRCHHPRSIGRLFPASALPLEGFQGGEWTEPSSPAGFGAGDGWSDPCRGTGSVQVLGKTPKQRESRPASGKPLFFSQSWTVV